MLLITSDIQVKLVAAHQANQAGDREIVAKFFTPDANATWYILDGIPTQDGDWELYCFCDIGDAMNAEFGYAYLSELRKIRGRFRLPVERDLNFKGRLSDLVELYPQIRNVIEG